MLFIFIFDLTLFQKLNILFFSLKRLLFYFNFSFCFCFCFCFCFIIMIFLLSGGWVVDHCGGYKGAKQRVVALKICCTFGTYTLNFFLLKIKITISTYWKKIADKNWMFSTILFCTYKFFTSLWNILLEHSLIPNCDFFSFSSLSPAFLGCLFATPVTFLESIYAMVACLWLVLFCGGAVLPACSGENNFENWKYRLKTTK